MTGPGNGLAWQVADHEKRLTAQEAGAIDRERRVTNLERDRDDCTRRLAALEAAKIDVLAEQIKQMRSWLKTLTGAIVTFVVMVAVGVAVALILNHGGQAGPG